MYISFRIKNIMCSMKCSFASHRFIYKKKRKKRFQSNFLIFIYFSIFIIYIHIFETEIFIGFSGKHYSYYSTWKNFISAWISAQYRNFSRVPGLPLLYTFRYNPRRTTGLNPMNEISYHLPIICLDDGYLKSCDVSFDTWWYFIVLESNFSYKGWAKSRFHRKSFFFWKTFSSNILHTIRAIIWWCWWRNQK